MALPNSSGADGARDETRQVAAVTQAEAAPLGGDARANARTNARHEPGTGSTRAVLVSLGLVVFTYAFQQTAVVPAIPTIQHAFHTSSEWSAWLLSGYLMVATVVTPSFGRLGDLRGEARLLLVSLAVFFAGSVGAATLPSLAAIIVCRAAQGFGGAVLPLSFAVARRQVPDEQVGRAIAGLTGTFGLGASLGFGTGGLMAEEVSWRLVFAAGAVFIALGGLLMMRVIPRPGGNAEGDFDLGGAGWLAAASLSVLLALTLGVQVGWLSPAPIALLLTSLGSAVVWVRAELHHEYPLIDLRVLKNRAVAFVNGATFGLGWGRFADLLLLPELVSGPGGRRGGFGADATLTGLFLVPDGIGTLVGGSLADRAARFIGPRRAFAAGLGLLVGGAVILAAGMGSPALVLAGAFVVGLGSGLATQASSAVTTRDVPRDAAAASSSLNSTVRRFSGGVGGQISIVILAATASSTGFVISFVLAAVLCTAGAVLSLATPHDR